MKRPIHSFRSALEAVRFRGPGYDVIRLLAASIVVMHHSVDVQFDKVKADPLYWFSGGYTHFGFLAVAVFFAISGFLVTPSLQRSGNIADFGVKRILRIYPALCVVVLVIVLVLGPILTVHSAAAYFSDRETYLYLKNMIPLTIDHLPGVSAGGKPVILDGALWTLYFEVFCYLALGLLSLVGALRHRSLAVLLFLVFYILNALSWYDPAALSALPERFVTFTHLFVFFMAGVVMFLFSERIAASGIAALAATITVLACLRFGLGPFALPLCVAYIANYLGTCGLGVRIVLKRDISYGVYLIHSPVLVCAMYCFPAFHIWWIVAAGVFCVTVPLAVLSSVFVEQPALRQKTRALAAVDGFLSIAVRRYPLLGVFRGSQAADAGRKITGGEPPGAA